MKAKAIGRLAPGFVTGLAAAVVVVVLAGRGGGEVAPLVPATSDAPSVDDWIAEATLADETVERFRVFRAGRSGKQLTLRGPQLSALLHHAAPDLVPPGVLTPTVEVEEGRVVVRAKVVTAEISGSFRFSRLFEELADTVDVRVVGSLVQMPGGLLYYHVDEAHAGRIPLPVHTVLSALETLSNGAPQGSISVPWPSDIGDVTVRGDRIFIRRFERIVDREVDGFDG